MSHRHQVIALSKLMTYILGHRPDEFGLVLDHDGFVSLKELQQAISEEEGWSYVRTSHITEVAYSIDREHFEIMDDRIRYALYTVRYEATLPPPILYHGTRRRAYPHIRERGIDPGGKQYVSLSTEPQLAMRIGRRRDPDPILVEIQAQRASDEGITFYHDNPLIYLADYIPPAYLSGPPIATVLPEKKQMPPRRREKGAESPPVVQGLPGSVLLNLRMEPLRKEEKGKSWKDGSRRDRRRQRHV